MIARELKRQKVADVSYVTVHRTAHRRGLHAFKQRKTSRLSKTHKRGRLKFATANSNKDWSNVVFSDEYTFKRFKAGNPRHDCVWAKSVSEVPGKEMERWGLTVDAWGGFSSQGKTELALYDGTLDAHAYQDIWRTRCSRQENSPKVLDGVNVITLGGPPFHHVNPMLLQPTLGGLCRVTRRLVLLEFPPFLFVFKPLLRGR